MVTRGGLLKVLDFGIARIARRQAVAASLPSGSIIGTLIGALIVGVFRNGLALSGLELLWQDFTVGVLIIVAVTIDQWIRRISA